MNTSCKQYKHIINHILIFQPLIIVAELIALYNWLLLWLVAYFNLLFQMLKHHLRVQERTFCCISTVCFTLKDWCILLSLRTVQHRLRENVYIVHNEHMWWVSNPIHWLYINANSVLVIYGLWYSFHLMCERCTWFL